MNARELRAQRGDLVMKARALVNAPDYDAEKAQEFDRMMAQADEWMARITAMERVDTLAMELESQVANEADRRGVKPSIVRDDKARAKELESKLFKAFMLNNPGLLSDAERQVLAERQRGAVQAAGAIGTGAAGGFTVAPGFMAELLVALKAYGGVRGAARGVQTETGVDMPWPLLDDTAQVATIVGENTAGVAGTDLPFGSVTLKAWMYRSGYLPVSLELLQDTAFDFDTVVRDALAVRFARGQNAHFTTGNGTSQPSGILTGGVLGVTGNTGSTVTVTTDSLIALEHSVDPAYRRGAVFMMHDSSLRIIKQLKDAQNRPLLLPGYESGVADTLLGYPVIINQDMPVMAANAKSIVFGNFGNYVIRDVAGLVVTRLNERFAENGQVAFIGFQRTDGRIVSAAAPIKWYANSAT